MEKRYYWLKLQSDFFGSLRIKKLRKMKRGDTLLVIYLKLQLSTLCKDGVFEYKGIEEDVSSELALDLGEKVSDVRAALAFLLENGMCEKVDDTHYYLPWVSANTGSETASTQRVRDYRERKTLQCNADVTQVKQVGNVDIEIEKEKDIKEKYKRKGRKNTALLYPQSEIKKEDFDAMVVDVGGN